MHTIEEVYNRHRKEIPYEIDFLAQAGHLFTLKYPEEMDEDLKEWSWDTLPIEPAHFEYKLIPDSSKGHFKTYRERFKEIRDGIASGQYDFIINSGDPDQEGELLIRETLKEARCRLPVKRFWTNDLTEEKVLEGLKNLRDDDKDPMLTNLLQAAYGRQHSDYRFGMNVTRAATLALNTKAACGRVKTPILSIVCRREEEIKNFVPKTSYGIQADYQEGFAGIMSEESSEEGKEPSPVLFDTEKEAVDLMASLPNTGTVSSYESRKEKILPPKFFKLATVQIAAGKYGFSSDKTLAIVQSLYEKKIMSYPRTDCEYISSNEDLGALLRSAQCVPELLPYIKTITNADIARVKGTAKWTNDAKLKESGHSALVPTKVKPDFSTLTEDEKLIYFLVAREFVAAFLQPRIEEKTVLTADIGGRMFRSTGKKVLEEGFSKLIPIKSEDAVIPAHKRGDSLPVSGFEIKEKTTTCPKRFRDSDLIAVCEAPHKYLDDASLKSLGKKLKLGTPATRASIIKQLIDQDHYLARKKEGKAEYIVPTDDGTLIFNALRDTDICKVDMTGEWEEELERVRQGEESLDELEDSMKKAVRALVMQIKNDKKIGSLKKSSRSGGKYPAVCKCPKCGGDILEGSKGYFCSNWKEKSCGMGCCKKVGESTITHAELEKLLNGEAFPKKIRWKNKETGKTSESTSDIRYNFETHRVELVKHEPTEKDVVCKCPKCGGDILEGAKGYYCSNWKEKGCRMGGFKKIGESILSRSEMAELLSGNTIEKHVVWKDKTTGNKKEADAKIRYNFDTGRTEFVREEQKAEATSFVCPNCGKTVTDKGRLFECSCGFKFWKTACGKELTKDEIKSFFKNGSTGLVDGLTSKKGKTFSAEIVLSDDKKGTQFRFSD